jgi:hypothetical protein
MLDPAVLGTPAHLCPVLSHLQEWLEDLRATA